MLGWIVLVQWAPYFPRFDSGAYITVARAIASGAGYVDTAHPQQPPFVLYPPVYPLMLAGFVALGLDSFDWLRVPGVLAVLGVLVWLWRTHAARPWFALGVVLLAGLGDLSRFAVRIQSEAVFVLILCLLVTCAARWCRGGLQADRWAAATAALAIVAVLERNQALGLIPGLVLMVLVEAPRERRARAWLTGAVVVGAACVASLVWLGYAGMLSHLDPVESPLYVEDWHDPTGPRRDPLTPQFYLAALAAFAESTLTLVPDSFVPSDLAMLGIRVPVLYELLGLLVLVGFVSSLRERSAPEHYLWLSSLLLIVIVPEREPRYVLPFVPFFAVWLLQGLLALRRLDPRLPAAGAYLVVLLQIGGGLGFGFLDPWRIGPGHLDQLAVVAQHADPGETVIVSDHYAVHVLTGRRALSYHPGEQKTGPYTVDRYLTEGGRWAAAVVPERDVEIARRLFARTGTAVREVEVAERGQRRFVVLAPEPPPAR